MIDFDFKTAKKDIRLFALILPLVLIIWGTIFGFKHGWGGQVHFWFYGIAVFLFLWGRVSPSTLKPIYMVWMVITRCLAWFLTALVVSLVFYIGFIPIGLLLRLLGKDFLHRRIDKSAPSYWCKRPPYHFDSAYYERQF